MFAANPHCFWCGKLMRLVELPRGGPMPSDAATIDHLYSRLHPRRLMFSGEPRRVLACSKCNNDRSREETKIIYLKQQQKQSGSLPLESFGYMERKRRLEMLRIKAESSLQGLVAVMGKPVREKKHEYAVA
jgi:hypothetical protein